MGADQYLEAQQSVEDATDDQYGFSGAGDLVTEPSAEPVAESSAGATPAAEFAPQAEADTNPVGAEAGPVGAEAGQV